jgi:5-methylcytosine-specific restriction protein A
MAELLKPYGYQELLDGIKQLLVSGSKEKKDIIQATDEDDSRTLKKINNTETPIPAGAVHKGEKKPAPAASESNGRKYYRHNVEVSSNALSYAGFQCEICSHHPTFPRRKTGQPYTEAHHLVPMSKQGAFTDASLDVEENVVSLCSTCHNCIHYGKEAAVLIETLYNQRKELLHQVGIEVTLEEVLSMY